MNAPVQAFPALLEQDETLFRVLSTKAQTKARQLAFLLKEKERATGLSVAFNCTAEQAEAPLNSFGVLSLVAHSVVGLGLTVVPDAPIHANIKNVPHKEDDEVEALRIAEELSQVSAVVVIRDTEKKKAV